MNIRSLLVTLFAASLAAQTAPAPVWKFAVSGDSRNCGGIVMPAIAAGVLKSGADFYWHLGDFRAIYDFDEDMVPPFSLGLVSPHLTISAYLDRAWPDFIDRQLHPFGSMEIFLGIGNHEVIFPKSQTAYIDQFKPYLNSARLTAERKRDGGPDQNPQTYFHWIMNGVDFLSLDNSVGNRFDDRQLAWIRARIAFDTQSATIRTVVVGMHEALPGSKGMSHSMCDSKDGIRSGREVYDLLWNLQQAGKKVYLLHSHSHFVMDDVYRTPYWGKRVLPGWIIGTAGAVRYRLPPGIAVSTIARTDVYGYVVATVMSDGSVNFAFTEVTLDDLRLANAGKTPDSLVRWCFSENAEQVIPRPKACSAE